MMKWKFAAWVIPFFVAAVSVAEEPPFNAQGELVGEVTPTTAILRARLTLRPERNPLSDVWKTGQPAWVAWTPDISEDVPGKEGAVRVHYGTKSDMSDARTTDWVQVTHQTDCAAQFHLTGLTPATRYYYRIEMAGRAQRKPFRLGEMGSFTTGAPPEVFAPVRFTVTTGQAMRSRDIFREGKPWGFKSYESMARLKPHFHVSTGDSVYYDGDYYLATDRDLARYHWHRIYSLPSVRNLFRLTSGYWMKDDHDYRWNDCDPHQPVPQKLRSDVASLITDEMGRELFKEAVPMSEKTNRTFAWGRGLQIWLPEGRDYRSPNSMPDGPEKTLWGNEQKEWLKKGLLESRASFKILISPTPLVGPDRDEKRDNHVNRRGFWTEGREFLQWVKESGLKNFYIICGDRHWQYHSIDETGVEEFSCGPISDAHAARGQPHWGKERQPHFRDSKGGFLLVEVLGTEPKPELKFTFHDVDGNAVYVCQKEHAQ